MAGQGNHFSLRPSLKAVPATVPSFRYTWRTGSKQMGSSFAASILPSASRIRSSALSFTISPHGTAGSPGCIVRGRRPLRMRSRPARSPAAVSILHRDIASSVPADHAEFHALHLSSVHRDSATVPFRIPQKKFTVPEFSRSRIFPDISASRFWSDKPIQERSALQLL